MFVPAFVLNQPSFKVKRAHFWEKPSFRRNLLKNNIDIAIFRFFLKGAGMYVFSIRANFKPDFISFPVHRTPLSRLSQWLTILSQQLHLCPEKLK